MIIIFLVKFDSIKYLAVKCMNRRGRWFVSECFVRCCCTQKAKWWEISRGLFRIIQMLAMSDICLTKARGKQGDNRCNEQPKLPAPALHIAPLPCEAIAYQRTGTCGMRLAMQSTNQKSFPKSGRSRRPFLLRPRQRKIDRCRALVNISIYFDHFHDPSSV